VRAHQIQAQIGQDGAIRDQPLRLVIDQQNTDFLFDFDQSVIRTSETSKVDKLGQYMKDNPNVEIGIDGYADPRGTTQYNQPLSQRRVDAIKAALVSAGVPSARIQTGAFGETRLKCSEATEACWQRDRRVEVLVRPGQ